jgi:hypothetical protein
VTGGESQRFDQTPCVAESIIGPPERVARETLHTFGEVVDPEQGQAESTQQRDQH